MGRCAALPCAPAHDLTSGFSHPQSQRGVATAPHWIALMGKPPTSVRTISRPWSPGGPASDLIDCLLPMRRSESPRSAFQTRRVYALPRRLEVQVAPKARKSHVGGRAHRRQRVAQRPPLPRPRLVRSKGDGSPWRDDQTQARCATGPSQACRSSSLRPSLYSVLRSPVSARA